jgi:hypothetical protein
VEAEGPALPADDAYADGLPNLLVEGESFGANARGHHFDNEQEAAGAAGETRAQRHIVLQGGEPILAEDHARDNVAAAEDEGAPVLVLQLRVHDQRLPGVRAEGPVHAGRAKGGREDVPGLREEAE